MDENARVRRVLVVHLSDCDNAEDPILAYIGEGVRQAMDANDGVAARSWMDSLHEAQELRQVAAVAAAWN